MNERKLINILLSYGELGEFMFEDVLFVKSIHNDIESIAPESFTPNKKQRLESLYNVLQSRMWEAVVDIDVIVPHTFKSYY